MKKAISLLFAIILLSSLLCIPALAVSAPSENGIWLTDIASDFSVSPCDKDGAAIAVNTDLDCDGNGTADSFYTGAVSFKIKYMPGKGLNTGDTYTFIIYSGSAAGINSILCVKSISVSAADADSECLNLEMSPSSMRDCVIAVTSDAEGFSTPVNVAKIHRYLPFMLGDVDGDGKVTTLDAVKILQYYVGSITLSENQLSAADTDRDGKVGSLDAARILQYYVGSISTL
jgi:hypothetical protein